MSAPVMVQVMRFGDDASASAKATSAKLSSLYRARTKFATDRSLPSRLQITVTVTVFSPWSVSPVLTETS